MDSIIKKAIVAVLVVTLLTAGTIPIINDVGKAHDADNLQAPMGAYDADELDGYSLTAWKYSGHVKVESTFYTGEIKDRAVIVSTSGGSLWTDGSRIYIQTGNTVRTVTSTTVTVEGGVFYVDGETVGATGTVYLPDRLGSYGSYPGTVHGDIISGVGSFAGVTVGSIGEDITGNNTDYVLDASVGEVGGLNGLEFVAGEVDIPEIDPFLPDIEHEEDPEPEPIEPGEYTTSGTTGSCTWELDGDVLSIRGTGPMGDYNWGQGAYAPWPTTIKAVIIEEGVTTIGIGAFGGVNLSAAYTSLTQVSVPSTVITIGQSAFDRATGLTSLELPNGLTTVRNNAFRYSGLTELILPDSVTYIGSNIVGGCADLRHLYIPDAPNIGTQNGYHFIRLDGYDMGGDPVGDLYLGSKQYVMYQTKTVTVDEAVYRINYIGAELETAPNTENVYIPYTVEYNGEDYTVESIAHNAISGSSVKYVVIPQTVESVSPTAITGSKVAEVLNLSAVDVMTSHGEVRTSVPAVAVVSDTVIDPGFGAIMSMINLVPILIILALVGFILTDARGRARER